MESILIFIKFAFLGLVQGFTEPIPISSSGHLVIAEHAFGLHIEGLSFAVLVNFSSLLAILLIYRQDLILIVRNALRFLTKKDPSGKSDFMFAVYLIIGTVPAAIIGILFNDLISQQLSGMNTIGITLLITGVALWLIRNLKGKKQDKDLSWRDAVIVGFAQAVALIPGISRSGATIVASMGLGMKQETALRFSFMLYIPVSIGGMLLEAKNLIGDPLLETYALPYAAAFVCSLVASYFSLKWFMGIMARGNLKWFSFYCFFAGAAVLMFL
ncbi:undecaprenyl-diphosphate phosphatase [Paenibacillus turpanensis]|uniref:undecaprenyl-diphosphate phosphatase n=1 Tax=Paenibacillus turpanensis TaxID=2689078 RepID=UPI00140BE762|nr:undecaprenyl-diphosphate phosphatase [Paenibacillus turpanensis]